MDNKKFEQLIDLIINENEEQARALFHDIVVEKSREIYEGMMDDEMEEGMGGQVGGLLDEIEVEEQGMAEGEGEDDDLDSKEFLGLTKLTTEKLEELFLGIFNVISCRVLWFFSRVSTGA